MIFHLVLLGFVISPTRTARYATVPRGVLETVHYTTLTLPSEGRGRARAPHRATRAPRTPHMERTPRMPAPPRVGQIDLNIALSLVSTQPMIDVAVPDMVDTLRSDAITESPFASSPASADVKGSGEAADSVTFIASDVDRAAAISGVNPKPAYPRQLLERGMEASFSVYFVVDTAGRIDTTTIQVPLSVDSRFIQAVREVLVRWRFVPAEVRGRRVRQLMEQTFKFQIISGQFTQALSPIAQPSLETDAAG